MTATNNEIGISDETQCGKKPLPKIVIKKRISSTKRRNNFKTLVHGRSLQLPAVAAAATTTIFDLDDYNNHHHEFDNDPMDAFIANTAVSLEVYSAICSLQQSIETCVTVPFPTLTSTEEPYITRNDTTNNHIRGVLECQIMEWFSTSETTTTTHTNSSSNNNHTDDDRKKRVLLSKRMIRKQIELLLQQNVIQCIPIPESSNHKLYLLTTDYIQYLQQLLLLQQQQQQLRQGASNSTPCPKIYYLEWWIRKISNHQIASSAKSSIYITIQDIESAWCCSSNDDSHHPQQQPGTATDTSIKFGASTAGAGTSTVTANMIHSWLQDSQLLLSASYDHTIFQLWLPTFGTMVLPTLNQLCKDVVLYIKRSAYQERSVTSVIERFQPPPQRAQSTVTTLKSIATTNSTSNLIPMEDVLIPYMVARGFVQRIEQPSGMFLNLR